MTEIIIGIVAGLATVLLNEYRRYRKRNTTLPPPPSIEDCKRCFFYRRFEKSLPRNGDSDTKIIRLYRDRVEFEEKDNG